MWSEKTMLVLGKKLTSSSYKYEKDLCCYSIGGLHTCDGTTDAEVYIGILERYMLSYMRLFPEGLWLLQQDNARPYSPTAASLHRDTMCVVDWSACRPNLFPIENV